MYRPGSASDIAGRGRICLGGGPHRPETRNLSLYTVATFRALDHLDRVRLRKIVVEIDELIHGGALRT